VWIALAAALNLVAYSTLSDRMFELALLVFFGSFFLYNFQRLWLLPYSAETISIRHLWINKFSNTLKVLCVISFLLCLNALWILQFRELIWGLVLLTLAILYSYFPWKKPLRNFGWLKTILVTAVWTFTVFFFEDFSQVLSKPIPFVRFVLLVYLLTLLFEYRDKENDRTPTLPRVLPEKWFAIVLIALNGILVCLDIWSEHYYLLGIDMVLLPVLIYFNFKKQGDLFYSFVVDGYLVLNAVAYALK
jgi:hypothetical protein